jgi:hypothetical protein
MPATKTANGAVGEPGDTCVLQLHNDTTQMMRAVVEVNAADLCRSHAAYATLLVEADPRHVLVDLNETPWRIETGVAPGEHVVLVAHLVNLHNEIMCIRLGGTEFALRLKPPA